MAAKLSIQDVDLKNKKVLIRVDFNVPIEKGTIIDDSRIRGAIPTIQYVLDQGGAAILMSHFGRPDGKKDPQLSLAPCAKKLSELINKPVKMAPDCCGDETKKMAEGLKSGEILMLENLRFHIGEEKPHSEPEFANALAELGEVYIDDAFGCAHRNHASITLITKFFPHASAAGYLMQKEIEYLGSTLLNPKRPFHAILGGSKISSKFKIIKALMQHADCLLIGGAMMFNFFEIQGISVGDSLVEKDFFPVTRELMDVSSQSRCRLVLPLDVVIAKEIRPNVESRVIQLQEGIPAGYKGLDIGPETIKLYDSILKKASTIFWNGPMGVFECPPFNKGTNAIAQMIANFPVATTIIGGGDSVAAVEQAGLAYKMSHLSTGGGAALEYIEFGKLPGIEALTNK